MVFSSLVFLFQFLPLTLLCYYLAPKQCKNFILLIFSLFFYAWGEPKYVLLLLFSSVLDYTMGRLIARCAGRNKTKSAKLCLCLSLFGNLGLLAVFKYTDFLILSLRQLFHISVEPPGLALPIGISFYTFQTLSYTIDVYRGKVKAQKNFITFATYVALFPQLVAGPIVRYETIEKELQSRRVHLADFQQGAFRFAIGLAKKVLIANTLGSLFEEIGNLPVKDLSTATAWLGVLAFTFQIYFDFSGYSDMAIGLGRMFGFHFLENFRHPYESSSVTEFWRRWHISLGSWFREYVYIPLGGNRRGITRQLLNILLVWFLTGLWHGASWNFVLWGLYYAILLILEKLFLGKVLKYLPRIFGWIYTSLAFIGGWALFCICDVAKGWEYAFILLGQGREMIGGNFMYYLYSYGGFLLLAAIGSSSLPAGIGNKLPGKRWLATLWMLACLMLSLIFLVSDTYNPFLYFRF